MEKETIQDLDVYDPTALEPVDDATDLFLKSMETSDDGASDEDENEETPNTEEDGKSSEDTDETDEQDDEDPDEDHLQSHRMVCQRGRDG